MVTFLADCSGKLLDATPFLPFLQRHIQRGHLSVIPFQSGANEICNHIKDFFRHQPRQPFQLIILSSGNYQWLSILNGMPEICSEKIFLNVLNLYDPNSYPNNTALNQLMPADASSLLSCSNYFSFNLFPSKDSNVSEKLQSQRNLFLFIEQLIITEQHVRDLLPIELALSGGKFNKIEFQINETELSNLFGTYFNKLNTVQKFLYKKQESLRSASTEVYINNTEVSPEPCQLPLCRLSGYHFPWPVKPIANFRGFQPSVNNWINEQEKRLEEYQADCEITLNDYFRQCRKKSKKQEKRSVEPKAEIKKTEEQIDGLKRKLNNIKTGELSAQARINHIRKNDVPPFIKGLEMIPDLQALAAFFLLSVIMLAGANYPTYAGSTLQISLLAATSILITIACIVIAMRIFIYKKVKEHLQLIKERLEEIKNDIRLNTENRLQEFNLTFQISMLIENKESLSQKLEELNVFIKQYGHHAEKMKQIQNYWKNHTAANSAYDYDTDNSQFNAGNAPEINNAYSFDEPSIAHESEIQLNGKEVKSNSYLSRLFTNIIISQLTT